MKFMVKNPSNPSFFLLQMMMIDGRLETELEKIMAIDVDLIERRCFSTWVDTSSINPTERLLLITYHINFQANNFCISVKWYKK